MPEIKGVEIFSTGTWNGDKYTLEDLNQIVANFEETKATMKPYLKLGHGDQKFLQKEGLPSAGWIERLYVSGEKLIADFADIPQKIYELIQKKAYRKVSCEMFWNLRIKEKTYRRLLTACALLGADVPAVMNLNDMLALYGLDEQANDTEIKIYEYAKEGNMAEKTEKELALEKELNEAKEKLAAIETESKTFQSDIETLKKENDLLTSYKKDMEAEKEKLELEKLEAERKNFILELEKENLCSGSMKPLVELLLSEEKKEYCIKQGDNEKKYSKPELIKETLKLFKAAQAVNFDESSNEGDKKQKDPQEEVIVKMNEYMAKNKCSPAQAYKAVTKKQEE